ncbi:MAG: hypothetical protein ACOYJS_03680 [Acutalibacteraceae bacterium]|jgi:hypothetical protein
MKEVYIDIMERTLSAYSEERIRDYIQKVKTKGLTEHGFPRLTAGIGILICHGRRTQLLDTFIQMMDICCEQMPKVKANNDFTVREICCLLMLLQVKNIMDKALLDKWRDQISKFDPWKNYTCVAKSPDTPVNNWAAFSGVSEFFRGLCCGIDTEKFVDWQISSQLLSFDENGMYKDPHNPMVYDGVARLLMCLLLKFGYNGKLKGQIEENLNKSADLTAKMQSVTGEIPFGGRSAQFLNNEMQFACLCEYYAGKFAAEGDKEKAGEFKAAARLTQQALLYWLDFKPVSHIKNKYGIDSGIGCEGYGYFNKYMITVASFAYAAYLLADDSVPPTAAVAEKGGFAAKTSDDFHKIFLNCGGYFAEIDTDADFHYDANGLGRIHKKGCHSTVCLSVPFPGKEPSYTLENENPRPMSLCCFAERQGETLYGSCDNAVYTLINTKESPNEVVAEIDCALSTDVVIKQTYKLSSGGVEISLEGQDCGFMLPVFDFDGLNYTDIMVDKDGITVKYRDSLCRYSFDGEINPNYEVYHNRNGRYKVFKVKTKKLKVTLENTK